MSEPATSDPTPQRPPRNNYGWIGFFVFLILASVGVTVFMIQFNLRIQLKPEQLEAARALWKEKGPKSYNMIYKKRLGTLDRDDVFVVKVRKGIVEEVKMNDVPLKANKEEGQEHDPRIYHSMDSIFRDIERFMDIDQRPNAPKVYVIANFEEKTGYVARYIRRVMGGTDRVELNVMVLEAIQD